MVDEHFGINVVEFMVCVSSFCNILAGFDKVLGCRCNTRRSCVWWSVKRHCRTCQRETNGWECLPMYVVENTYSCPSPPTGYHAKSIEEFAEALGEALSLSTEDEIALRRRARTWAVQRFSEEEFEKGWNASRWKDYLGYSHWIQSTELRPQLDLFLPTPTHSVVQKSIRRQMIIIHCDM